MNWGSCLNNLLQNPMETIWEGILYLLKTSCRENRRYDIEYVLKTTLKTLVEKVGDMRYVLVLLLPHYSLLWETL
jgi:hypothetical protein